MALTVYCIHNNSRVPMKPLWVISKKEPHTLSTKFECEICKHQVVVKNWE